MFSKFTIILKLVFQLKSFTLFSKLTDLQALGIFSNSAAATGVARGCLEA